MSTSRGSGHPRALCVRSVVIAVACAVLLGSLASGTVNPASAALPPAPVLETLSPAVAVAGTGGFVLTVTGKNFVPFSAVRWNGAAKLSVYISPTELHAIIDAPDLQRTGSIPVVVEASGQLSNAVSFAVIDLPATPTISSVSPSAAVPGGAPFTLTVTGTNFIPTSVVRWNGFPRATTYASTTQLRAAITAADIASAGSASVSVFTPAPGGGTSLPYSFPINATPNPAPVLLDLDPAGTTAGDGALTVTVTGSNFVSSSLALWNGSVRPTRFVSTTQLQVDIPADDVDTPGTASIGVFTAGPGGGTSGSLPFEIGVAGPPVNPTPALASLTPVSATVGGAGLVVTVTGGNFVAASNVYWNGEARATQFVSATVLKATIPATDLIATGTAVISVITPGPGGGLSNVKSFTIVPPPLPPTKLTIIFEGSGRGRVSVGGGAVDCPGSCQVSVAPPFELVATPASGSHFDTWGGICFPFTTDTCRVAVAGSVTVTVNFSGLSLPTPLHVFVNGFYEGVLERSADPAGLEDWVTFLRLHGNADGAQTMVQGFFNSAENLNRPLTLATYVRLLYTTILQREPSPAEVQGWVDGALLPALNELVPGFVDSPEFQALLRVTPPADIVHRLYVNVLGRNETPEENAFWVARVAATGDWEEVAIGFLDSTEYVGGTRSFAEHVRVLYRTFLGREADPAGLTGWLGALTSRLTTIQLGFTRSAEFQGRIRALFSL